MASLKHFKFTSVPSLKCVLHQKNRLIPNLAAILKTKVITVTNLQWTYGCEEIDKRFQIETINYYQLPTKDLIGVLEFEFISVGTCSTWNKPPKLYLLHFFYCLSVI